MRCGLVFIHQVLRRWWLVGGFIWLIHDCLGVKRGPADAGCPRAHVISLYHTEALHVVLMVSAGIAFRTKYWVEQIGFRLQSIFPIIKPSPRAYFLGSIFLGLSTSL